MLLRKKFFASFFKKEALSTSEMIRKLAALLVLVFAVPPERTPLCG